MSIQNDTENEAAQGEPVTVVTSSESAAAAATVESPTATVAEPPASLSGKKVCGVCNEKHSKYKCTRCELPYCSIACFTIHKTTHSALPPPTIPKPLPSSLPAKPPPVAPRPGTKAAAHSQGLFAALDDSDELRALFKHYPNLAAQLHTINNASLPPLDPPDSLPVKLGKRKEREKQPWTTEIGTKKGVQRLKRMRAKEEGVMEYSKLVLQILNGDMEENAAEQLQREEKAASVKMIEALLNGELHME